MKASEPSASAESKSFKRSRVVFCKGKTPLHSERQVKGCIRAPVVYLYIFRLLPLVKVRNILSDKVQSALRRMNRTKVCIVGKIIAGMLLYLHCPQNVVVVVH